MRKPEIRIMARPATRTNYEAVMGLAWSLFEMGIYADVNMVNGDQVVMTHGATDEQLRMAGFKPAAIEIVEMREVTSCGQGWVAEIELCPLCGLSASAH